MTKPPAPYPPEPTHGDLVNDRRRHAAPRRGLPPVVKIGVFVIAVNVVVALVFVLAR